MKKNIAVCLFLINTQTIISMNQPWAGKPIARSFCMDPRYPDSLLQPGESLADRDARLATEKNIAHAIATEMDDIIKYLDDTASHPFSGSPDLLGSRGLSPRPLRSPRQVKADLVAQAAANRKDEESKK
jgi:hypothetical protein